MEERLDGHVVVLVGASSGIGRATALRFARLGARVVVAARDGEALDELASEIEADGGAAMPVTTDVAAWAEVSALADRAVERFGRIDTWVHGAAVSVFGEVAEVSVADIERVLQVDLFGQVYGVKAALPVMRRQGGGTIIGISSVLGVRAVPIQAAYSAAKHGVEGFFEALRLEERRARSGVEVTTILPATINTPFYDAVKSYLGERPAPIPPLYQPEVVAEAIVQAARRPGRRVVVGGTGAALVGLQRLSPALTDRLLSLGDQVVKRQRRGEPDQGQSNLHVPAPGPRRVRGSFDHLAMERSLYDRWSARRKRPARLAAVAALATAVGVGAASRLPDP